MKLSLFLLAVLSSLALAAPPKARPVAPKPAVPVPQASGELDAAVQARIQAFFTNLAAGKVEDAYARLLEGSTMVKEQPEMLAAYIKNTTLLIRKCGEAENGSVLKVRSAGKSLKEVTCILNCKKQPIRWKLYVYYGDGRWQVLDAEAETELSSFFEPDKTADKR